MLYIGIIIVKLSNSSFILDLELWNILGGSSSHCLGFHKPHQICSQRFFAILYIVVDSTGFFTTQPLRTVRVLFTPMVSRWVVARVGKKLVQPLFQKHCGGRC